MDFTSIIYKRLLDTFIKNQKKFVTYSDFTNTTNNSILILRHDVDKFPQNSLNFARIQYELGLKGTYYFRIVPQSFNADIIKEIADLGHEIGYHYENISLAASRLKIKEKIKKIDEDILLKEALNLFEENLEKFRKLYPVKKICMHGSPLSKYNNRDLWEKYNYRDYGIIGEPYFDIDFNEVFYLTDTGRRWDGADVSVRDKIKNDKKTPWPKYRTTLDIIKAVEEGTFPEKVMMTFHPQRWHDKWLPWTKELVWQNTKNVVKKYFFVR